MKSVRQPIKGVADIFNIYGQQYKMEHKLPVQHLKTMFAIQHCRTAMLGGHIDICGSCNHQQISYNSCRNRHCPKCQGLKREKWVDKLSANLLPTKYFHMVFTIPSELNRLTLVNQKALYDILFKASSQSVMQLAKDPKYLNATTGMIAVLHTWGQNLTEHPHLHTMLPAGGWNEMAQCWTASRKKFFLPVKVVSIVFRAKFLLLLKQAYAENQLKFEGEIKSISSKTEFNKLITLLYQKQWVVFCKKPFKNHSQILNYLGRYSHRVAIDNRRISAIEDDYVHFDWKDYKDNSKHKIMKLKADEFIRRFLLHVLPKGFCKIRYFGIFASRNRSSLFIKCRKLFSYAVNKSRFEGLDWKAILLLVTGKNVILCPICKTGNMEPTLLFKGSRASPL